VLLANLGDFRVELFYQICAKLRHVLASNRLGLFAHTGTFGRSDFGYHSALLLYSIARLGFELARKPVLEVTGFSSSVSDNLFLVRRNAFPALLLIMSNSGLSAGTACSALACATQAALRLLVWRIETEWIFIRSGLSRY
jgi:hypothetical protein